MVDFDTLYAVTVPLATLAPWALVAPFLGLFVGVELTKIAERKIIQRRLAQATNRYAAHGRREGWWV
jgi:hypothetical protein